MYFYKKGRGRYKAAPSKALEAALASQEKKRRQAEQQIRYMQFLNTFTLPEEFRPLLVQSALPARQEYGRVESARCRLRTQPN